MSDPKDFVSGVDSNARKEPRRVVFVTRRTSAQVRVTDEEVVQTFPEVLFRAVVAIEVLAVALVWMALLFNAPLEGIADPSHTPNPAKAPWYFLGLQEMLHYFPPVVAGVLVPGLVVIALIVIPYFNINVEAEGVFVKDRTRRLAIFYAISIAFLIFLVVFDVYVALAPTVIIAGLMIVASQSSPQSPSPWRRYLAARPLSFWIMTWFLFELAVLTAIGTFFRGPGLVVGLALEKLVQSSNNHRSLWQRLFGDPIRAFGTLGVIILVSLAIAPAKNHFSEWRHYQNAYLSMIRGRGEAVTLQRHFEGGIQQIWHPELGRRGPMYDLPRWIEGNQPDRREPAAVPDSSGHTSQARPVRLRDVSSRARGSNDRGRGTQQHACLGAAAASCALPGILLRTMPSPTAGRNAATQPGKGTVGAVWMRALPYRKAA